jgi:hypothetical protein
MLKRVAVGDHDVRAANGLIPEIGVEWGGLSLTVQTDSTPGI